MPINQWRGWEGEILKAEQCLCWIEKPVSFLKQENIPYQYEINKSTYYKAATHSCASWWAFLQ